jgi:hypothetical protein
VIHQRLNVLGLKGRRHHSAISQGMQLIGDERQHTLAVVLGPVAALPVIPAQLLELVVQCLHGVHSLWLVFLTTR